VVSEERRRLLLEITLEVVRHFKVLDGERLRKHRNLLLRLR